MTTISEDFSGIDFEEALEDYSPGNWTTFRGGFEGSPDPGGGHLRGTLGSDENFARRVGTFPDNYTVLATIEKVPGGGGECAGVTFRVGPTGDGYAFMYSRDGYWFLTRDAAGDYAALLDTGYVTDVYSTIDLEVEVTGTDYIARVDGSVVSSVSDTTSIGGNGGPGVFTYSNSAEIWINDWSVDYVDGGGTRQLLTMTSNQAGF